MRTATPTHEWLFRALLFLYFLLKPFYLFPSGGPQIADLFMMILFLLVLLGGRLKLAKGSESFVGIAFFFVLYTFVCNGVWSLLLQGNWEVIQSSVWYTYNFLVTMTIVLLFQGDRQKWFGFVFYCVSASILMQFLVFLLGVAPGNDAYRTTLFFNNPNQLGYFGLMYQAIAMFLSNFVTVPGFYLLLVVLAAQTLVFASLSKAAIISSVLMYFAFAVWKSKRDRNFRKIHGSFLVLAVTAGFVALPFGGEKLLLEAAKVNQISERISAIGDDNDDNLAARGYDRIVNHPEYLLFGSGEGAYGRFSSKLHEELHSTIANIFFSYGVVGTFLFLSFLAVCVNGHRWFQLTPLFFIFLYGLSHNGIREPGLWILLALIFSSRGWHISLPEGAETLRGQLDEKSIANMRHRRDR